MFNNFSLCPKHSPALNVNLRPSTSRNHFASVCDTVGSAHGRVGPGADDDIVPGFGGGAGGSQVPGLGSGGGGFGGGGGSRLMANAGGRNGPSMSSVRWDRALGSETGRRTDHVPLPT